MKVSTKGRYALRLMVDLAERNTGEFISLKDISARQEISTKYLEQIVVQLCKAGFLKSVRGPQGGYKLSREPKDYTAGEILKVTEGSLAPVACLGEEMNDCPRYSQCSTIVFWEGLNKLIQEYVESVTLQDIVEQHKQRAGWDFSI